MQELLQQKPAIADMFADLHPPFQAQAAVLEAGRCLNCFDAPCTGACPTHIDVPKFIKKIASGNLHGAALGILDANILGASCARACPVDVLCEGACVMHGLNEQPIKIGRLQRYATDNFHAQGGKLPRKSHENRSEKIACIGAGPASLAAAAELKQRGFQVTIFDKRPLPGGLNTYGIAEYKLPLVDSLREIELIKELGVDFRFGVEIGGETSLATLEAEFDIIFIGVGLGAMHKLAIPDEPHPAVIEALQFIEEYKTGKTTHVEGNVIVVGAGNTAIDAANAAKRLGAKEVSILYRRTREHISAFDFEYRQALQEGVHFLWLTQLIAIHGSAYSITSVECERMEIDAHGQIKPLEDSRFHIECNAVIPAIGQSSMLELLAQCRDVQLDHGHVVVDRATGQTTNPKYFSGGDCVNGGREVVDAVADGKRAGVAIARLLEAAYV
ncbi:MAG TPA: FAD-dependent oxidoreductase [Edaphobacter sp.]|nr:FAD-dependent oxidoreductase [Edaphobacter sp.]